MASIERIIDRPDGTQVRIVAWEAFGTGLHRSVGVDVFKRSTPQDPWHLCNDQPAPGWKQMPRQEYIERGRSEKLQTASHGEILHAVQHLNRMSQAFA